MSGIAVNIHLFLRYAPAHVGIEHGNLSFSSKFVFVSRNSKDFVQWQHPVSISVCKQRVLAEERRVQGRLTQEGRNKARVIGVIGRLVQILKSGLPYLTMLKNIG